MTMTYDSMGLPTGYDENGKAVVSSSHTTKSATELASEKFNTQFMKALDVQWYEKAIAAGYKLAGGDSAAGSYIISQRTAEQTMDAFQEVRPEWKSTLDEIRKDPALLKATHNVLSKDATMLEEFGSMAADMGTNPQEFANALKDPKTRKALTKAFDKIAESDKLTGKDFRELYDNRNDQSKTIAKLQQMGVGMTDMMDMQSAIQMLTNFLRDPVGFLKNLPDMLASMGIIGPIQAEAWKESPILKGAQMYAGVVLGPITGESKGFGGYAADAIEKGQRYYESGDFQRDLDRYTGEADRKTALKAGMQGDASNPVSSIRPTKHFDLARNGLVPHVTPEQEAAVREYDNAATVTRLNNQGVGSFGWAPT